MTEINDVYQASQLVCDAYAEQVKNTSGAVQEFLIHKIKHTFQVAHEIMNILFHEKELYNSFDKQDKQLVEISAILHDLGRFYQHQNGQRIIPSTQFEHGTVAVNLLKKHPKFNNPMLLFAIGEHNHRLIDYHNPYYTGLNETDKKKAEILAKLLRDADKLDNIRHTVYVGYFNFVKGFADGPLSEGMKDDIKNRRPASIDKVVTLIDRLAVYLAWVNDIYFDYTKEVIRDLDFVNCLISQIKKVGVSAEDIAFLEKYLTI